MGEDQNHREHNAFGHNGAYRDHRWDKGWGAHGARAQQLTDDEWRIKAKLKMKEEKKALSKESNILFGPRNEGEWSNGTSAHLLQRN